MRAKTVHLLRAASKESVRRQQGIYQEVIAKQLQQQSEQQQSLSRALDGSSIYDGRLAYVMNSLR